MTTEEPEVYETTPRDEALSALGGPETIPQLTNRLASITDVTILREMGQKDDRKMAKAAIGARIGELTLAAETDGALTPAEMLMIETQNPVVNESQDIFDTPENAALQASNEQGAVEGGTIEHRTMATRALYVKDRAGIWIRRTGIPLGNVPLMIAEGARADCGHCGSPACRTKPGERAYDCPSLTARMFGRCPVCSKLVDDPLNPDSVKSPGERDPREIEVTSYSDRSPEERIKARIQQHMGVYHEGESAVLGVNS